MLGREQLFRHGTRHLPKEGVVDWTWGGQG